MDATWIIDKQDRIYTIVKTRAKNSLVGKYPSISFTQEIESTDTKPTFPTVLIEFLPSVEISETLDSCSVCSISIGTRITVVTNKSQGQDAALRIAYSVINEFAKLGFKMAQSPELISTEADYREVVAIVTRLLASNDVIQ